MAFTDLLTLGVDSAPVYNELFNFGTVIVSVEEPFYLMSANFAQSVEELFNIQGFTSVLVAEPFNLAGNSTFWVVESFNMVDATVGQFPPSYSPVITVDAAAGATTVTVADATPAVVGGSVVIDGVVYTVLATTPTTITLVQPLVSDVVVGTTVELEGGAPAAPIYGWWDTDRDVEESVGTVVTD